MLVLGLDSLMLFATDHICVVVVVVIVVVVVTVVVVDDVAVLMITLFVHDYCSLTAFTAKFNFGRENKSGRNVHKTLHDFLTINLNLERLRQIY